MYKETISLLELLILGGTVACILFLVAEITYPFTDATLRRMFPPTGSSKDLEEYACPELDPTVIHAFLKDPTEKEREEVASYILRRDRREAAEESSMLERLRTSG